MTHSSNSRPGSVFLGLAATLLVASAGLLAGYAVLSGESSVSEASAAARPPAADAGAVQRVVADFLAGDVTLRIGGVGDRVGGVGDRSVAVPWSALGAALDPDELSRAAAMADPENVVGTLRAAGYMPVQIDRDAARRRLAALKIDHDIAPRDARMDLESRTVHREADGLGIDVLASLAAVQRAAQSGSYEVTLRAVPVAPAVTVADLGIDDISHVLATFETQFATNDKARNYNLKLAASKLNGYVLAPGVEFSFNDVVGPRTENEGYKVAHVITAGEMVDGLAGGTCQISTTLHGAAFFAGIGVINAIPHSRPSTYVTMGLDATVVYPHVDLKLRNDYDFPVAIHFKVSRGRSTVEILGRERPYDEVAFERKMVEKLDFDTITREDESMPVGAMKVDQYGFYGYKIERLRKFYKDGKMVKRDRWRMRYAPVTEYARLGINPDPNLLLAAADGDGKKEKRLKEPSMDTFRLTQ